VTPGEERLRRAFAWLLVGCAVGFYALAIAYCSLRAT